MNYREERAAMEMRLREYLSRNLSRVREECGHSATFEHGTFWCSRVAQEWSNQNNRNAQDTTEREWPGWSQFMFIRDNVLIGIFRAEYGGTYPIGVNDDTAVGAHIPDVIVVGEHYSKSIPLPVMQFEWRDMLVTTRYNYHDWKVSVKLPEPIDPDADLLGIAKTDDRLLHPVYFEGFPQAYIYPPLASNDYYLTAKFSSMFSNSYNVYTFFWLLKKWYDGRFGPVTPE